MVAFVSSSEIYLGLMGNFYVKVVMSFHECGGNVGDDVCIPLPHW